MAQQTRFQAWSQQLLSVLGRRQIAGNVLGGSATSIRSVGKSQGRSQFANAVDPIMMRAMEMEMDARLQQKFAAIREEEQNILDKLILMD